MKMKKLMTVAATALCASVFANTAVESSNIVGYSQYALTKANQFVTSSFKNVGNTALDLTQIKVVGYTGASIDKVSVQFIDAAGNTAKDSSDKAMWYYWQDSDGANGKWVKKDGRKVTDVAVGEAVLGIGDALWWQKKEDGLGLQFSGEVIQAQTSVSLPSANQAVGNMMAVPVDLTSIKVGGYSGASTDKVTIQIIDAAGNTAKDSSDKAMWYYWQDSDGVSGKWVKKDGRKVTDVVADEVILNPGDGIWVSNKETTTAYTLVFPATTL
jgi:hypothetical protein